MASPILPPPPFQSPMIINGQVTQPWLAWFTQIYTSSGGGGGGGGGGGTSNEVVAWALPTVDVQGLEAKIDGATALALSVPAPQPAGENREIQFNDNGILGASPKLVYLEDDTTIVGIDGVELQTYNIHDGGGFEIRGRNKTADTEVADTISIQGGMHPNGSVTATGAYLVTQGGDLLTGGSAMLVAGAAVLSTPGADVIGTGGSITITAGSGDTGGGIALTSGGGSNQNAGDITLTAGGIVPPVPTPDDPTPLQGLGGNIIMTAGDSDSTSNAGSISMRTGKAAVSLDPVLNGTYTVSIGDSSALLINQYRAFGIGATQDFGSEGEVLVSHGALNEPTWELQSPREIPFHFGDATPKNLFTMLAGQTVLSVSIVILEPFDDLAATLSVGDAGDTSRLLEITDNIPSAVGTYSTEPGYQYSSDEMLLLSITPGTSTQGYGLVIVNY